MPRSVLGDPNFTEGTVTIQVKLVPPGIVEAVTVKQSSGNGKLDESVKGEMSKLNCTLGQPLTKPLLAEQSFTFKVE